MAYPQPALLYVASSITTPSKISKEAYDAWYDNIHVPHVLETPGISSAVRYDAVEDLGEAGPWPFLALYPVDNVEVFSSQEFTNIPLTSDALPGPTHNCLDIAKFDNRRYRQVGKCQDQKGSPGQERQYAFIVEFDLPSDIDAREDQDVLDWYTKSINCDPQEIRLYRIFWSVIYQNDNLKSLPTYLAVNDFNSEARLLTAAKRIGIKGRVSKWKVHTTATERKSI